MHNEVWSRGRLSGRMFRFEAIDSGLFKKCVVILIFRVGVVGLIYG